MQEWHSLSIEEVAEKTGGNLDGLSEDLASQRLKEFGPNALEAKKRKSPLVIFLHQFADVMILVLIVAAGISFFLGETSDTIIIVVIIFLNAIVGFIQEYRAEKAMEALQKMAVPMSNVIRNGHQVEIASTEIVPGDLVVLEAGNMVPADLRLVEVHALKADESSLTGESHSIDKSIEPIPDKDIPPGDKTNLAFKGTVITNGRGKGIVFATGMKTELGKIAGMLQEKESVTPLQRRMAEFSKKLTVIILVICAAMFTIGYLRGEDATTMLLTAISVAVAAIPEALPAVITISLALGAKKLVSKNVLIRKLHAVETLGSVSYICSDKTGTLTKNEMTVKEVWTPKEDDLPRLIRAMSLNHDVKHSEDEHDSMTGDPTEIAMVNFAEHHEAFNSSWLEEHSREEELPFDSDRKAMTTINKDRNEYIVITKGASEAIASMLKEKPSREWKEKEDEMAKKGMRIIAFAERRMRNIPTEISPDAIEKDLQFIGLAGLIDPPRKEVKTAIEECKTAGITAVMITGDHPLTAGAIASELGILDEGGTVITGKELAGIPEEEYREKVESISVYARVSPEQKLKIIKALQSKDHYVAMTGDGVNDAPSLRKANIGVAMGITGTDVTREAAHMILLDDNFATIVQAVRQGRRIYDNIRKFVKYILTGNTAEIWTIFLAPLLGLPIPLLPVHILWVNLVTDGLPALALASEPAERDIMKRQPRPTNESIFAGGLGKHVLWVGILIGFVSLGAQKYFIEMGHDNWQTLVFTILCFCQLWHVLAIRSDTRSLFKIGLGSNRILTGAVILTVLLQLAIIYLPFLNVFFHTAPLTATEILIAFVVSSIPFWAVELEKKVKRIRGIDR